MVEAVSAIHRLVGYRIWFFRIKIMASHHHGWTPNTSLVLWTRCSRLSFPFIFAKRGHTLILVVSSEKNVFCPARAHADLAPINVLHQTELEAVNRTGIPEHEVSTGLLANITFCSSAEIMCHIRAWRPCYTHELTNNGHCCHVCHGV